MSSSERRWQSLGRNRETKIEDVYKRQMVKCAITEAEKCNAEIVRCHTSSKSALNEILQNACVWYETLYHGYQSGQLAESGRVYV